jgi:hypothetical protein
MRVPCDTEIWVTLAPPIPKGTILSVCLRGASGEPQNCVNEPLTNRVSFGHRSICAAAPHDKSISVRVVASLISRGHATEACSERNTVALGKS